MARLIEVKQKLALGSLHVRKNKQKTKHEKRERKINLQEEIHLEFCFLHRLHKSCSHPICIDLEISQMRHFRLNVRLELYILVFQY